MHSSCSQLNILSNSTCTWYSSSLLTLDVRQHVGVHVCVHARCLCMCALFAACQGRASCCCDCCPGKAEQWSFGLLSSCALPPGPSSTNLAPSPLLSAFSCLLFSLPAWPLIIRPSVFLSVLVTVVPPPLPFLTALLPSPPSYNHLLSPCFISLSVSLWFIQWFREWKFWGNKICFWPEFLGFWL